MYSDEDFNNLISLLKSDNGSESDNDCAKNKLQVLEDYANSESSSENESSVAVAIFSKYKFVAKPRILRCDIRRSYMEMFVSTMNSFDYPLLFGFLDTYCTPNTQQYALSFHPTTMLPMRVFRLQGIENMAKFWFSTMLIGPDATSRLTETQVHLKSNTNETKIVSKFSFNATKVFDVPHVQTRIFSDVTGAVEQRELIAGTLTDSGSGGVKIISNIDTTDTTNNLDDGTTIACDASSTTAPQGMKRKLNSSTPVNINGDKQLQQRLRATSQSFINVTNALPILSQPIRLCVEGSLIIYTDSNMRITQVVMESVDKKVCDEH